MKLVYNYKRDKMTEEEKATSIEEQLPTEETQKEETQEEDLLAKANKEIEEQKDKYIRLFAEFDNYKKRMAKERIELFKTAGADIIQELLVVLDDIDRGEKIMQESKDIDAVKQGIVLIKDKLFKTLQQKGLQIMDAKGKQFDADFHEAITEIPAPSKDLVGKVVEEIEKGYLLNEKIIRYAKVVVGR
jgi:molecular chaperone GrpE